MHVFIMCDCMDIGKSTEMSHLAYVTGFAKTIPIGTTV